MSYIQFHKLAQQYSLHEKILQSDYLLFYHAVYTEKVMKCFTFSYREIIEENIRI